MASGTPELPDAGKWFGGFIDITRWIKDGGTLVRLVVILILGFLLYTGVKDVLGLFKKPMAVPGITATNTTGGKINVDTTQQKRWKFGIFNLW